MTETLDDIQAQVDALKAFIGIEGYRQGQQRIRAKYMAQLQDEIADAKLILADTALDEKVRLTAAARGAAIAETLKRRVDELDKQLGTAAPNGNRAARRRNS